jgi:mono/diheme cytochrome c family protein
MRRAAVVLGAGVLLLAACGSGQVVLPTAKHVSGKLNLPKPPAKIVLPAGNGAKGKSLFAAQGCGGCHSYKPAGSNGNIGPDLDNLASYTQKAKRGDIKQFTAESIIHPQAYLEPGYGPQMPTTYSSLPKKQIADLVAFLTKK